MIGPIFYFIIFLSVFFFLLRHFCLFVFRYYFGLKEFSLLIDGDLCFVGQPVSQLCVCFFLFELINRFSVLCCFFCVFYSFVTIVHIQTHICLTFLFPVFCFLTRRDGFPLMKGFSSFCFASFHNN